MTASGAKQLACNDPIGRAAVANLATGHADLADAAIIPIPAVEDHHGWAAQDVDDIVGAMHRAVDPAARGPAAIARRRWDWDAAAEIVVNTAQAHLARS